MGRIWMPRAAAVAVMLALPAFGFSYATLKFAGTGGAVVQADDANGDVHSHCHTGSKGNGAGGNDKVNGGDCAGGTTGGTN